MPPRSISSCCGVCALAVLAGTLFVDAPFAGALFTRAVLADALLAGVGRLAALCTDFFTTAFLGAGLRAAAAFTGLAGLCAADWVLALAADVVFAGLRGAAFLADLLDCLIGVALFTCFGFALAARATTFFAPLLAAPDLDPDVGFALAALATGFFAPRLAAPDLEPDFDFAFAMSVASTL
jgi:hypothetical protein